MWKRGSHSEGDRFMSQITIVLVISLATCKQETPDRSFQWLQSFHQEPGHMIQLQVFMNEIGVYRLMLES